MPSNISKMGYSKISKDYSNRFSSGLKPVLDRLNSLLADQGVSEPKYDVMLDSEQGFGFAQAEDEATNKAFDVLRNSGELRDILVDGMAILFHK